MNINNIFELFISTLADSSADNAVRVDKLGSFDALACATIKGTGESATISLYVHPDGGVRYKVRLANNKKQHGNFVNIIIPGQITEETVLAHAEFALSRVQNALAVNLD